MCEKFILYVENYAARRESKSIKNFLYVRRTLSRLLFEIRIHAPRLPDSYNFIPLLKSGYFKSNSSTTLFSRRDFM